MSLSVFKHHLKMLGIFTFMQ